MRQYKQVSDDLTDLRHNKELIEQYQTLIFLALLTSHLRQRVYALLKTSPKQLLIPDLARAVVPSLGRHMPFREPLGRY